MSLPKWSTLGVVRAVVACAALVLVGCPGASCPAGTLPDPPVLAAAAAPHGELRSLRAEAAVTQSGPDGRIRGQVLMFMQRPDRVRFDAMSQFGPVAILTSDGERFALSDLKEKRFVEGPTCRANIARMLGVQLSSAEVLGLLLGELPVQLPAVPQTTCQEGVFELHHELVDGGSLVAGFSAGPAPRLTRVKRQLPDGSPAWSVRYEGSIEADGVTLPRIVELEDHQRGTELNVRFKRIEPNVEVPEGAFSQQPRPGLAREEVPCPEGG